MVATNTTDISKKLKALQLSFKHQLDGRLEEINKLWEEFNLDNSDSRVFNELYRMIHSLAGSGGAFGAVAVSTDASECEQVFKELIDPVGCILPLSSELQQQINDLFIQLKQSADAWDPSDIPCIQSPDITEQTEGNLIYLAEDDELFAADLVARLEYANYRIKHFVSLSDFEMACINEKPSVVIMDIVFSEGDIAGAEVIGNLKSMIEDCPPVIFISVRQDIEARLAAARAGANRYFCKPLDYRKLISTLDGLTARVASQPYRVLLVDDDEMLLTYYETIVRDAGMDVVTVSQPLKSLEVLSEFKPDVIVMDMYMPGCSGAELAQVIRQDDTWAMMPIMFLSTETDISRQLTVMNLGGDDFLIKPVVPDHLVASIVARAQRARRTNQIYKDMKNVVRESEFQLVTMDQHDIVSTTDITGKITNVNNRFCDISGYSRAELVGQNHRILKSGMHPSSFYDELWKTISSGKVWHGTICNCKKDGGEYWVESTIVPFLDERGKPYKYVSARTDVTALRQGEERLNRSQEFANIGTWDWDIMTGMLYWSDRIWPLFGYEKEVTETTYDNFLAALHPDDKNMVVDAVNNCIENGVDYNIEHRVVWPDGSVHWVHESGDVVRNTMGKPLHMLGVVQDISKRKQTEQAMIDARNEAEAANRAKSQFLSSMSHELRTPMNAILGFSQLLKMESDKALTVSQSENVDEIYKAGSHLLTLINEVLDLAKIEAGRIDLVIEKVDFVSIIVEALQLIMPLAQKRNIEIVIINNGVEISIDQLLTQHNSVRADRIRLKQVLINLLSNAVKYNIENGKIVIACHYAANNLTRIAISDTGPGLDRKQQGNLFKAFERMGAEHSEVEGTGVGLVITKSIVELMGGRIGVDSQQGEGSTFWVELPTDDTGQMQKNATCGVDVESLATNNRQDYDYTVLYIEDNPVNLRLVNQLLARRVNINLLNAHEPLLGIDLAIEYKPDLILLDINLPGMNGYDVFKLLRGHEITHHIPVIAISANTMQRDIENGLEAGFDDYITKPIDVDVLLKAVDLKLFKVV